MRYVYVLLFVSISMFEVRTTLQKVGWGHVGQKPTQCSWKPNAVLGGVNFDSPVEGTAAKRENHWRCMLLVFCCINAVPMAPLLYAFMSTPNRCFEQSFFGNQTGDAMQGFLHLASAMVLQSVEHLSDEDKSGGAGSVPTPKSQPKPAEAKPAAKPVLKRPASKESKGVRVMKLPGMAPQVSKDYEEKNPSPA